MLLNIFMVIYGQKDFRSVLRWKIEENKEVKGYRTRMAEAAGFQRSFLSHVLNGSVLLTQEHALRLSHFWSFDEDSIDYFLYLVGLSRAQSPSSRRYYEGKLKNLRKKHQDFSERLNRKSQNLPIENQTKYYSSWLWSAIHIATSVPKFRTSQAIATRLQLPLGTVERTLESLRSMSLVEKKESVWSISKHHLHLVKESTLTAINHTNWRQKVISRLQTGDLSGLHYSVVYGLSEEDIEKIRELVLELVEKTKKIVEPSPEQELVCFLCDFFTL